MSDHDDSDRQSDVSDIDPESEVLAPVQRRIEAQLRRTIEDVTLQLREASHEATAMKQRREDVGVDLYNVQQHLARLQENLEQGHSNQQAIRRLREEKEREREQVQVQADALERAVTDMRVKHARYQQELDKLNETLMKVGQFNQQMQGEIQVERRAAYKAEEDVVHLERAKQRQDYLIDALNERIKALGEQQASLATDLAAQRAETKIARDTLAEAMSEMEAIHFEKKQLIQQWKASLVGMQRRDEAVRVTEDALRQQKEKLLALDNELVGYRQSIKVTQQDNAKLAALLSKTEGEVGGLERQIDHLLEKRSSVTQKFNVVKSALEHTEAENHVLEGDNKRLESDINAVVKRSQRFSKEVVEMEAKVMEVLSKQTTLRKGSHATLQDIEKLRNKIREKELHVTQMENELARIRVDTLQTQAHNEVLKQTLAELERELHARDGLIDKMNTDIRRRHDEIERKQKQLDSLNRQYDAIVAAQGNDEGEHVGPLEATINNLSKAISQKSSENDLLQKEWIKLQTELVHSKNYAGQLSESIQELKAQCTVLTNKRDRLLATTKREREELLALEASTQHMHLEMTKLNTFVHRNAQMQEGIASDTHLLENDLVKRLQERKREALLLERRVAEIHEAKSDLLAQTLDAERDIMHWEKKLQIAKETEMALDPNMGKDEIQNMKREIYIMEQRLANLQREQRRKVEEMQRIVDHRDVLRTKGQAIQSAAAAGGRGVTKATVAKENARLAAELSEKKAEAQQKERQIKTSLANTEQIATEVERVTRETAEVHRRIDELRHELSIMAQERDRAVAEKARKQRSLQRFRDAEKGLYKLSCGPEEVAEERRQLETKRRTLSVIMQQLAEQFPALNDEIRGVSKDL